MTPIQRRLFLLAPLGVAAVGGAAFWTLLERMREGSYDPHGVPSMLIGKPLPSFSLPGQPPSQGFSSTDVIAGGRPVLINFFASWCIPCVQEAPVLMALKQQGTADLGHRLQGQGRRHGGLPAAERRSLHTDRARRAGRVAIDFGVYGVPETYLVDKVRHRALALGRRPERGRRAAVAGATVAEPDVRLAALLLLCAAARRAPAHAVSDPGELLPDRQQELRAEALGHQLRCLVCQNESVEESNADLARDLRRIIRQRVVAGDSDQQVIDWMVARYGDFVRLRPPFNAVTFVLWGAPGLALLVGIGAVLIAGVAGPPRRSR